MRKHWLYSAVLAVTISAPLPLLAQSQTEREQRRDNREQRQNQDQDQRQRERERDLRTGQDRRSNDLNASQRSERRWQKVDFETLSGAVKGAVRQHVQRNEKVVKAAQTQRDGKTIYFVEVAGPDRSMGYTVDEAGKILSEENTTEEGRVVVQYDTLPGDVKRTLGKEVAGRPIKRLTQVTQDELTYFVAKVDTGSGMETIRVAQDGELLIGSPRMLSERGDRDRRFNPADEERLEQGWDRQRVQVDEIPGPVKATIGSQYTSVSNITEAYALKREGRTVYRVTVNDNNRMYSIRLTPEGKVLDADNVTEVGRERVTLDQIPGEVKTALLREHRAEDIDRIFQVTRRGDTWYEARTKDGHMVRIGRDGNKIEHDDARTIRANDRDADRDRDQNRDRDRQQNRDR